MAFLLVQPPPYSLPLLQTVTCPRQAPAVSAHRQTPLSHSPSSPRSATPDLIRQYHRSWQRISCRRFWPQQKLHLLPGRLSSAVAPGLSSGSAGPRWKALHLQHRRPAGTPLATVRTRDTACGALALSMALSDRRRNATAQMLLRLPGPIPQTRLPKPLAVVCQLAPMAEALCGFRPAVAVAAFRADRRASAAVAALRISRSAFDSRWKFWKLSSSILVPRAH